MYKLIIRAEITFACPASVDCCQLKEFPFRADCIVKPRHSKLFIRKQAQIFLSAAKIVTVREWNTAGLTYEHRVVVRKYFSELRIFAVVTSCFSCLYTVPSYIGDDLFYGNIWLLSLFFLS